MDEQNMNKKQTSKRIATVASKTLKAPTTSSKSKAAAGSALSQRNAPKRETSAKVSTVASKILVDKKGSKATKSVAGSALAQKGATKKKVATKKMASFPGTGNTGPRKK
jgi:hypothetical protein